MSDDVQRDLGKHEAKIETIEERLVRIEAQLSHLVSAVDRAKGGWQVLLAVSAFSSAVTAVVFKVWGLLKGGGM